MSTTPALAIQSQSQDATLAFLVDSTGIYGPSSPGGYGAPNQARSNISSSSIQISLPNMPVLFPPAAADFDGATLPVGQVPVLPVPGAIILNGSSTPSAGSFANGTIPIPLSGATLGLALGTPLPNGVYGYVYQLNFQDGSTVTGQGNFFLIGAAQVCLNSKIGALSLLTPGSSCYDNESASGLSIMNVAVRAAQSAYTCGDLYKAQKLSEWLDVRCNTVYPGSTVTNYGQSSSGLPGCGC